MAKVNFSLAQACEAAFGYKTTAFDFPQVPARKESADTGGFSYWARDAFGREYYMPARLGGYDLPYPVVRISGRKVVVKTPLTQRRGTFKQEISIDDYYIVIRGIIITKNNEFPESEIKQLRELFERPGAQELRSAITDLFLITPERSGFDKVVIEDFDFPETVGTMNVRAYELRMYSDEPFNLIEKGK